MVRPASTSRWCTISMRCRSCMLFCGVSLGMILSSISSIKLSVTFGTHKFPNGRDYSSWCVGRHLCPFPRNLWGYGSLGLALTWYLSIHSSRKVNILTCFIMKKIHILWKRAKKKSSNHSRWQPTYVLPWWWWHWHCPWDRWAAVRYI